MKIVDVEAMILDTGKDYSDPSVAVEAHGVRFVSLIRIMTDAGITGWSDIETQPHAWNRSRWWTDMCRCRWDLVWGWRWIQI